MDEEKDFTTITGVVITKETFDKYYKVRRAKDHNMTANFKNGAKLTGLTEQQYGMIYMNYIKLCIEFYGKADYR